MFVNVPVQALYRPADCDRMARCVRAVLAFAEHPAVEGSRMFAAEVNLRGMGMAMEELPDIGVGPKALLVHAINHPLAEDASRPFTALDTWLSVSSLPR